MNYMKEIAKMLGVEFEEEFTIGSVHIRHKINQGGLFWFNDSESKWITDDITLRRLLTGERPVVKISKPVLDEKEKEYLSNIIKPWRDQVERISKVTCRNKQYISINLENEVVNLPSFKNDVMYKGMTAHKLYTLEELGL